MIEVKQDQVYALSKIFGSKIILENAVHFLDAKEGLYQYYLAVRKFGREGR